MSSTVLPLQLVELVGAATDRAISPEARRANRDLRFNVDLAPSVSVDEVYQEAISGLLHAYRDGSQANWDGYGAHAVEAATFAQALAFLKLVPSALPPPEVMPHPDGELAFEWSLGQGRLLTVSVNGSGKLSYAALIGGTRQHGTEFLLDTLPDSITLALRRLHSAT